MTGLNSLGRPFWIETRGRSPVLRAQLETGDLIYAEALPGVPGPSQQDKTCHWWWLSATPASARHDGAVA
ncbi:MAG TPA: hypothetical protein VF026_06300 [Ktedonobacteraceae bacterium]